MPSNATPAKIARIEQYGARMHLVDGFVKDALDACNAFAAAEGVPLLHPFDTFETVAGAGTMALEIEEQVSDVERVVVGCGGGGLYAGLAIAFDGSVPVQPVEPRLCPNLADALGAGHPVATTVGGVAADSLGAPHIGEIAFETALHNDVSAMLVDEAEIHRARRFLWDHVRVLAEPGACVAIAAVLTGQIDVRSNETLVVIVSGANNDSMPD